MKLSSSKKGGGNKSKKRPKSNRKIKSKNTATNLMNNVNTIEKGEISQIKI